MATRISLFDFKKSIVEIHLTIDEQRNFDSCEDEPDASAPLTSDEIAKYGLSEGKNIWKHLGVPDYVAESGSETESPQDLRTLPPSAVMYSGDRKGNYFSLPQSQGKPSITAKSTQAEVLEAEVEEEWRGGGKDAGKDDDGNGVSSSNSNAQSQQQCPNDFDNATKKRYFMGRSPNIEDITEFALFDDHDKLSDLISMTPRESPALPPHAQFEYKHKGDMGSYSPFDPSRIFTDSPRKKGRVD